MQGLWRGLIWGGVVGVAVLGILSELSPRPGPAPRPGAPGAALERSEARSDARPDARPEPRPVPKAITDPAAAAVAETPAPERPAAAADAAAPAGQMPEIPPGSEFARPAPDLAPARPAAAAAPSRAAAPTLSMPATVAGPPAADRLPARPLVLDPADPAAPPAPAADTAPPPDPRPGDPPLPRQVAGALAAPVPEWRAPAADRSPPPPVPSGLAPGPSAAPGAAPSAAQPDPARPGTADRVVTDRLPRIGAAPRAEVGEAPLIEAADRRPIERFARPFDNPEGKPPLAVVLIDAGEPDLDRDALARLPFPVTFALDPMLPGAAERAAIYRSAGQEVVMLATGIPAGAQASDLAVTFEALADTIPEAVAVLDLPEGGLQANRPLATQVVPILGDQGRGLLSWDQGLNAADQVARREGLPSAVLFRRIDEGGADAQAIRRALDRAVFRAGQTGQVAVAGAASPATVAALLEWTVEGRAAAVILAPVTALMTAP